MVPLEEKIAEQLGVAKDKARRLAELLRQEQTLDYLGAAGSPPPPRAWGAWAALAASALLVVIALRAGGEHWGSQRSCG